MADNLPSGEDRVREYAVTADLADWQARACIEVEDRYTVELRGEAEAWRNTSNGWQRRAEEAEAEVERLRRVASSYQQAAADYADAEDRAEKAEATIARVEALRDSWAREPFPGAGELDWREGYNTALERAEDQLTNALRGPEPTGEAMAARVGAEEFDRMAAELDRPAQVIEPLKQLAEKVAHLHEATDRDGDNVPSGEDRVREYAEAIQKALGCARAVWVLEVDRPERCVVHAKYIGNEWTEEGCSTVAVAARACVAVEDRHTTEPLSEEK